MRGSTTKARVGLSRVITGVTTVIVLLIVAGILLIVLEANPDNGIVSFVTDVAEALVGPFDDLFKLKDNQAEVAVNWGIAAIVYLVIGRILAALAAP